MKAVLALLLSFVFIQCEAFALSGGPIYPASQNVQGTYAGVLLPDLSVATVQDPLTGAQLPVDPTSLGLFTFDVPQTGLASGAFLMFSQGRTFIGTINAFANPDDGSVQGILSAQFTYNISSTDATGTVQTVAVTANALGNMTASISQDSNLFNTSLQRIDGNSTLFIDQGGVSSNGLPIHTGALALVVSGIQQSPVSTGNTTSISTGNTGNTGNTGG